MTKLVLPVFSVPRSDVANGVLVQHRGFPSLVFQGWTTWVQADTPLLDDPSCV